MDLCLFDLAVVMGSNKNEEWVGRLVARSGSGSFGLHKSLSVAQRLMIIRHTLPTHATIQYNTENKKHKNHFSGMLLTIETHLLTTRAMHDMVLKHVYGNRTAIGTSLCHKLQWGSKMTQ